MQPKKHLLSTRFLSVLLAVLMLLSAVPFAVGALAEETADYKAGDTIQFGSYPQTKVTDTDLIAALNAIEAEWVSYGYYYNETGDYGTMVQDDYMQYKDVSYNGERYRAVKFTAYRSAYTCGYTRYTSSEDNCDQDDNGYFTDETYWFKYEPLTWLVVDPDTGLVLCKDLIDAQAFSDTVYYDEISKEYYKDADKTVYACNYTESTIRQWLNDTFYNTAFNILEQQSIDTTELDNYTFDGPEDNDKYGSADTEDKVFFLSYTDVLNPENYDAYDLFFASSYGMTGSDYAKCQGLWTDTENNNCNYWWLRSDGWWSEYVYYVDSNGYVGYACLVESNFCGVRPALTVNLSCLHTFTDVVTAPTCTEQGYTTHTCTKCGNSCTDAYVPAIGHRDENLDGSCDVCGQKNFKNCSHLCHKDGGFYGFIWKLVNLFNKIFRINQYCSCGARHW